MAERFAHLATRSAHLHPCSDSCAVHSEPCSLSPFTSQVPEFPFTRCLHGSAVCIAQKLRSQLPVGVEPWDFPNVEELLYLMDLSLSQTP